MVTCSDVVPAWPEEFVGQFNYIHVYLSERREREKERERERERERLIRVDIVGIGLLRLISTPLGLHHEYMLTNPTNSKKAE